MALSDERVIALLSKFYIPVFTSNEDYTDGTTPPEERAELERIRREGHAAKLSVGTVHAFVLAPPDGRLLDTMHVATMKADALAAMLEKHARALGTVAGPPPGALRPGAVSPPPVPPGALRLHLTARYLERRGNTLSLVEGAGGNWSALPGEDWLALSPQEQARWLSPPSAKDALLRAGSSWEIAPEAAWPLLTRFYPPTENNDLAKNRREQLTLTASLVSPPRGGSALARLEGSLRMRHPFYHKDDAKTVTASVVGYLTFAPEQRRIRSLEMVTEGAEYGVPDERNPAPFGVAVRTAA